ncbi:bis(5'-nucleosyl)-tetraphosphatase (symmetrical) YqeK [Christensenellaceae bacterium OttesenSCG-928-K19]|nr:bis(5'-nucleosyl)-tetraphosphatase (symmetrical) YqeK [Christensenellaceae bacterium OttesenSCG-928-K19]
MVALLQKHVKGEKFTHSLGVEQTALRLAKRYGADVEKAGLAGLLHDIAKQMDTVALAYRYGIVSPSEKTLHGPVGAAWLREKGIVEDEEVLFAIKYHTTGRADMSLLEKIVYLADYIEPARDFDEVDRMREYANTDIDKALLYGIKLSMMHVVEGGSLLDMDSVEAYNCYRRKFERGEI